MKKLAAGIALALSVAVAATAFAEPVHREIPYKKTVSLYTPRIYTFHFSIYDAASFGSELWFEKKALRLKTKTLSYALGSDKTFDRGVFGPLDFSEQYWIQVSYWTGKVWKVLGTRDKFAASPYALWGVNPTGPKGDKGDQGIQGEPGDKGDPGEPGTPGGLTVAAYNSDDELLGLLLGQPEQKMLLVFVPSLSRVVRIREDDGTIPLGEVYYSLLGCSGTVYLAMNTAVLPCG